MATPPLTPASIAARVSLVAFGAITLVLIAVGYWYYRTEVMELARDKYEALSAIGERKSLQLVQWRKERQMDAYRVAQQISPALHRAIEAALASQEAVFSEFYRVKNGTAVYVDTVEAIRGAAGRPVAVVAIRNDACSCLFLMIQSWPLPSRSAETFLVQRSLIPPVER